MRTGLTGTGRIGAFQASTLAVLPDVEAVVVTAVVAESAARPAEEGGYELDEDLDGLQSRVDALGVTTSTTAHAETLRSRVAAGLPAFCEKPVATTLLETVAPVELAEQAGRIPSPTTVADALAAFRVAEACEQSRATGRPVELDEIMGAA